MNWMTFISFAVPCQNVFFLDSDEVQSSRRHGGSQQHQSHRTHRHPPSKLRMFTREYFAHSPVTNNPTIGLRHIPSMDL